jgi:hypothetical protein
MRSPVSWQGHEARFTEVSTPIASTREAGVQALLA